MRRPDFIHVRRDRIERLRGRLKEWRAVATRYEETAGSSLGVLCLAAAQAWLKGTNRKTRSKYSNSNRP